MELVLTEAFLTDIATKGIGFDPRYPDSRHLTFLPPREHSRFWTLPFDPFTWPHFTASLLKGLDAWEEGCLWPGAGKWPARDSANSLNEGVRDVLLRGAGLPGGWFGAVRWGRNEESRLVAVLYAFLAFGWCGDDDVYFVPSHGRQILRTDHHGVIHVECESENRVLELVAHMADAGYALPTELPDWTFKRPAWMDPAGGPPN